MTEDEHWMPQSRILAPEAVSYDFVGRFERLRSDAETLMRRMGFSVPFPSREALEFPGTNANALIMSYFSESAVHWVRQIYRDDFEAFAYSLNLEDAVEPA